MKISNTFGFYGVKITAIFIMSIIYFLLGSLLSIMLNEFIPSDNIKDISTPKLIGNLSFIFGIIGVVYYILRIQIKHIPFFLDGVYGFKYNLLREASGGIIIGYIMYSFLDKLKDLMNELGKRVLQTYKQLKIIT